MRDDSTEIFFQSVLQEVLLVSSSGMDSYVHSLTLSIPLSLCQQRRRSSTKDGLAEAAGACDMCEPCKFPFPDSRRKELLVDPQGS